MPFHSCPAVAEHAVTVVQSSATCTTHGADACLLLQVGMQNSALGAVLAAMHFSDPLTAVPCALSACLHSCMGSGLAAFWRSQDNIAESADTMAAY